MENFRHTVYQILNNNLREAENGFAIWDGDLDDVADEIDKARNKHDLYENVRSGIVNYVVYGFSSKKKLDIALELKLIDNEFYQSQLKYFPDERR